jgi:transposase
VSSPNVVSIPPGEVVVDPSAKPVRRTFTAEYRARIVAEYERAPHGEKSAVLRREGLYQSQLREWAVAAGAPRPAGYRGRSRRAATSPAAAVVGDHDRALRAERDRLVRDNTRLAKQLSQTEAALEIMGKLHVLLESISESTGTPPVPRTP